MNKLLFAVLALASIGAANAQVKIAVINTQKALLETEEIKKAQLDLEAKFKPRQDQMVKLQKDLQDIQAQLQSGKLNQLGEQELTAQDRRAAFHPFGDQRVVFQRIFNRLRRDELPA